jgi:hypothetical protein
MMIPLPKGYNNYETDRNGNRLYAGYGVMAGGNQVEVSYNNSAQEFLDQNPDATPQQLAQLSAADTANNNRNNDYLNTFSAGYTPPADFPETPVLRSSQSAGQTPPATPVLTPSQQAAANPLSIYNFSSEAAYQAALAAASPVAAQHTQTTVSHDAVFDTASPAPSAPAPVAAKPVSVAPVTSPAPQASHPATQQSVSHDAVFNASDYSRAAAAAAQYSASQGHVFVTRA